MMRMWSRQSAKLQTTGEYVGGRLWNCFCIIGRRNNLNLRLSSSHILTVMTSRNQKEGIPFAFAQQRQVTSSSQGWHRNKQPFTLTSSPSQWKKAKGEYADSTQRSLWPLDSPPWDGNNIIYTGNFLSLSLSLSEPMFYVCRLMRPEFPSLWVIDLFITLFM